MGQSKATSQLANKATPALTDKLYLSDASTTPPTDKYITISQLQGVTYKKYVALLTQTGTNAPVATVLENTIGNIVWARGGTGQYTAALTGAFTINKTYAV